VTQPGEEKGNINDLSPGKNGGNENKAKKKSTRFNLLSDIKEDKLAKETEEMEEKERNAKLNRLSKKRFGHAIRFEKYKTSNWIKIICITLGIIIIPLEIFVQNVL
jgi:hypothetical protein